MSEKILVLVEGVEKETTFFETFNRNYIGLNDDIRLVPFGCNIYSLFQEMKGYDFEIDLEKAIEFPPLYSKGTKGKNQRKKTVILKCIISMILLIQHKYAKICVIFISNKGGKYGKKNIYFL